MLLSWSGGSMKNSELKLFNNNFMHEKHQPNDSFIDHTKERLDAIETAVLLKPHAETVKERQIIHEIREQLVEVCIKVAGGEHVEVELKTLKLLFDSLT